MDRCDACGFVYDNWSTHALPDELQLLGRRYRELLDQGKDSPRMTARTQPDVWAPLEYACHMRDVLLMQRERLYLALVEDRPAFRPMYREERPALAHYSEQDPMRVAWEIELAASLFSRACGYLTPDQWQRLCVYNYPAPTDRTLQWLSQNTLHEGLHHLQDIRRGLAAP